MAFQWESFYLTDILGLDMQELSSDTKNMVNALVRVCLKHMKISMFSSTG